MEDYQKKPVCQLSGYNYKVEAKFGPTVSSQVPRLTVFDTGAGPNLIRASLLPPEMLANIDRQRSIVKLTSASKHPLDVLGIVTLTLTVSTLRVRQPFVVVRQLGADVILGCTFSDLCVEAIRPRQKEVTLRDGSKVDIQRRPHGPLEEQPSKEDPTVYVPPRGRLVRVAQRVTLPPLTETNVLVRCGLIGTFFTESSDTVYHKKQVSISNRLVEVRANQPFVLRVANFGRTARVLQKNERLGSVVPAPDLVNVIDFAPSEDANERNPPSSLEDVARTTRRAEGGKASHRAQARRETRLCAASTSWTSGQGSGNSRSQEDARTQGHRASFDRMGKPDRSGTQARRIVEVLRRLSTFERHHG